MYFCLYCFVVNILLSASVCIVCLSIMNPQKAMGATYFMTSTTGITVKKSFYIRNRNDEGILAKFPNGCITELKNFIYEEIEVVRKKLVLYKGSPSHHKKKKKWTRNETENSY